MSCLTLSRLMRFTSVKAPPFWRVRMPDAQCRDPPCEPSQPGHQQTEMCWVHAGDACVRRSDPQLLVVGTARGFLGRNSPRTQHLTRGGPGYHGFHHQPPLQTPVASLLTHRPLKRWDEPGHSPGYGSSLHSPEAVHVSPRRLVKSPSSLPVRSKRMYLSP